MSTTALSIKQSPFQLVTLEHTSGKTRAYEITSDQLKIKNDVIDKKVKTISCFLTRLRNSRPMFRACILLIANYNAIPLFLECAPGQIDRLFDVKWLSLNGNIA